MAKKNIIINGVDFTSYVPEGYTVGYNKVSGENEGRMLNGSYREDVIAVEAVITLPALPLDEEKMNRLLTTLYKNDYASVQYFDPKENNYRSISARYETQQAQHRGTGADGKEYWTGLSLVLTENVE